jgi:hypothetical protein
MTIVMWPVMFYTGYLLFSRLAPSRHGVEADQQPDDEVSVQKATQ